jgi:hypothetical protein
MCFGSQRGKRACSCFHSLPSIKAWKRESARWHPDCTYHSISPSLVPIHFVLRVALILHNPFSASPPSLFLRKLAVLLVTWPVLDLAFSRAIPIFQINAVRQHSSQYKATWNHGLLTLGPCTHYTA